MAKIIYGVAGEGFGHSSRSHLIGQRFIDSGHEVMLVGSQKSLIYLKQYFSPPEADVKEIFGLSFAYEDGRIDKSETLKRNLLKLPEANRQNDELFKKHFEPFAPDLVISDFEPFSAWWAWRNNVPFLSIDHEHMLTLCKFEHPEKNWFSRLTATVVTECHYVGAVAYIIVNFFKSPLRVDSAVLAPPIIRPAVAELEPAVREHILIYSTTGKGKDKLVEVLRKFDRHKFCIYGFDISSQQDNCTFKKRSTEGFLSDLASARGVIASAGFSLLSECMHLRKKMLLIAVAGQYEQIVNAHYVQKLGLGITSDKIDELTLSRFIDILDGPITNDERILWPDNDRFFQILQDLLSKLRDPISIALP